MSHSGDLMRIDELVLPAQGFDAFTYPRYRGVLSGRDQPETAGLRIAAAAWAGAVPVGLAFLSRESPDRARQLLSVMVAPLMRRQGLGLHLLQRAVQLAGDRGTTRLLARHSSRMFHAEAFEALIRRAGWKRPEAFEYRLGGKASWSLAARQDWAPFLGRLEEGGFGVLGWSAIGERERAEINAVLGLHGTDAELDFHPFRAERDAKAHVHIIPEISVLLLRRGAIVGWIIGQRGALPDTFHYSSGYVIPPLRRAGWLIGGVREVCQRQAEHFGGDTVSVFETAANNHAMRRFMDRQLKPYSLWTDTRYHSEKALVPDGASLPPVR